VRKANAESVLLGIALRVPFVDDEEARGRLDADGHNRQHDLAPVEEQRRVCRAALELELQIRLVGGVVEPKVNGRVIPLRHSNAALSPST
jgi:hypothetical protein